MWAVGRLSLLSRGLTARKAETRPAPGAPGSTPAPLPVPRADPEPEPAPVQPRIVSLPTPVSVPATEPAPASEPAGISSPMPGLIQRMVTRVKSFFRSLFG